MLERFGFERIGAVAGDRYFVDPDPRPGREGAERGVPLELRFLERGGLPGIDLLRAADHGRSVDPASRPARVG